jgi:hypothetical protein
LVERGSDLGHRSSYVGSIENCGLTLLFGRRMPLHVNVFFDVFFS